MDNSALVPDSDLLMGQVDLPQDETLEANVTEADNAKADLVTDPGWKQIVEILDRHIDDFRTGKKLTIDSTTPLEEIGKKFVVASTIASICEEIKADVINAANAVIERGRK